MLPWTIASSGQVVGTVNTAYKDSPTTSDVTFGKTIHKAGEVTPGDQPVAILARFRNFDPVTPDPYVSLKCIFHCA